MADEGQAPIRTSIRSLYLRVLTSFDQLQACLDDAPPEMVEQLPKESLNDQLGYFRLWAGNNGAHRKGRISLDHKLRLALHVHDKVTEYLTDLESALHTAIEIVKNDGTSHPDTPTSNSSASSSDDSSSGSDFGPQDDLPTTTPLEYALDEIDLRIKCLMRLSVVLRQPAHRDYQRKLSLPENRMDHYIPFDIKHVEENLAAIACNIDSPNTTADEQAQTEKFRAPDWLTERLGKANTQRRQLLAYFKNHHEKIAKYVDAPALQPLKTVNKEEPVDDHDDGEDFAGLDVMSVHQAPTLNMSMRTQTTVTTVHNVSRPIDNLETVEAMSEGGQTETSFGTNMSWREGEHTKIEVPPPPKAAEPLGDRPFQCPFCMIMINPGSTRSWERHVFRDLKPYICTFENCSSATHLYDSRREWSNHESQIHRRQYYCPPCNFSCTDCGDFKKHLHDQHPNLPLLESTISSYGRAILTEQNCNLCGKLCRAGHLAAHLGRHMQQLALFVLPKELDDREIQSGDQGSAVPSVGHSSIITADSDPSNGSCSVEFTGSEGFQDDGPRNEEEDVILEGSIKSSTFERPVADGTPGRNLGTDAGDALNSSDEFGLDEDDNLKPPLHRKNTEMPEHPYFAITITVRLHGAGISIKGPFDAVRNDIDRKQWKLLPDPYSPSFFFTEIVNASQIADILRGESAIPYIISIIPAAKLDEEPARQLYQRLADHHSSKGHLIPGTKCTVSLLDLDGVARHRNVLGSNVSYDVPTSSSFQDLMRDFTHAATNEGTKSTRFPKEYIPHLQERIEKVWMGFESSVEYKDDKFKQTFDTFYIQLAQRRLRGTQPIPRRPEDLLWTFYFSATKKFQEERPGQEAEWKPLVNRQVALFVKLMIAVLKEQGWSSSHPELSTCLYTLEKSLLRHDGNLTSAFILPSHPSPLPQSPKELAAVTHIFVEIVVRRARGTILYGPLAILRQDIPNGLEVSKFPDKSRFQARIQSAADLGKLVYGPRPDAQGIHIHITRDDTQIQDPGSIRFHREFIAMGPLPSFSCTILSTDRGLPSQEDLLILLGPDRASVPSNSDSYQFPGARRYDYELAQFFSACKEGNTAAVKDLLRDHPRIMGARFEDIYLPIHIASKYGRSIEILEAVLGAHDPSTLPLEMRTVTLNNTPLHCAAETVKLEKIKYLLDRGANPWLRNIMDETPLDLFRRLLFITDSSVGTQIQDLLQAAMRKFPDLRSKQSDVVPEGSLGNQEYPADVTSGTSTSAAQPSTEFQRTPVVEDHGIPHKGYPEDKSKMNPHLPTSVSDSAETSTEPSDGNASQNDRLAVAQYDFTPENENELALVAGRAVVITSRYARDGWLEAEDPKTGRFGLVPEGFLYARQTLVDQAYEKFRALCEWLQLEDIMESLVDLFIRIIDSKKFERESQETIMAGCIYTTHRISKGSSHSTVFSLSTLTNVPTEEIRRVSQLIKGVFVIQRFDQWLARRQKLEEGAKQFVKLTRMELLECLKDVDRSLEAASRESPKTDRPISVREKQARQRQLVERAKHRNAQAWVQLQKDWSALDEEFEDVLGADNIEYIEDEHQRLLEAKADSDMELSSISNRVGSMETSPPFPPPDTTVSCLDTGFAIDEAVMSSEATGTVMVSLEWTGGGDNVFVTGTFCEWKKKYRLAKSGPKSSIALYLPPGTHHLKFIVDGNMLISSALPITADYSGIDVNYIEVSEESGTAERKSWPVSPAPKDTAYSRHNTPAPVETEKSHLVDPVAVREEIDAENSSDNGVHERDIVVDDGVHSQSMNISPEKLCQHLPKLKDPEAWTKSIQRAVESLDSRLEPGLGLEMSDSSIANSGDTTTVSELPPSQHVESVGSTSVLSPPAAPHDPVPGASSTSSVSTDDSQVDLSESERERLEEPKIGDDIQARIDALSSKLKNSPRIATDNIVEEIKQLDWILLKTVSKKPTEQMAPSETNIDVFDPSACQPVVSTRPAEIDKVIADLASRNPLSILLAEDNPVYTKVVLSFLETMGYTAVHAKDGIEVLELCMKAHSEGQMYDVILMDISIPPLDGYETSKALSRRYVEGERPSIVALMGDEMAGTREKCRDAGMDICVAKPIQLNKLALALMDVGRLRERSGGEGSQAG